MYRIWRMKIVNINGDSLQLLASFLYLSLLFIWEFLAQNHFRQHANNKEEAKGIKKKPKPKIGQLIGHLFIFPNYYYNYIS